jgi:hypothetical protein
MASPKKFDEAHEEIKKFEEALELGGQIEKGKKWLPARLMEEAEKELKDSNWKPCAYGTRPAPPPKPKAEPVEIVVEVGKHEFMDHMGEKPCLDQKLYVDGKSVMVRHVPLNPASEMKKRYKSGIDFLEQIGWEIYYQNNPDKLPEKKASWAKAIWTSVKWAFGTYGVAQLAMTIIKAVG